MCTLREPILTACASRWLSRTRRPSGLPSPGTRRLSVSASLVAWQSNGLAWAAEQVGELLALEDRPADAATALGLSEAIRGAFDHGEPVLRALVAALVRRLGEDGYRDAYARGAALARPAALDRLGMLTGRP